MNRGVSLFSSIFVKKGITCHLPGWRSVEYTVKYRVGERIGRMGGSSEGA